MLNGYELIDKVSRCVRFENGVEVPEAA